MARKNNKLPSLSNVAAGSTATLQIPLGTGYESIKLVHTGVTAAQMKNIEVRINGKPIWKFKDGTRLDALNKYYKRNVETGYLTFWFSRIEMENNLIRRMTGIGTMDISTFEIVFDIDAAASDPVVEAWATKSQNMPLGMITKIKTFPSSSATSGIKEIDNIPKEGRIGAIHLFKADISKAEVEVDSERVYEFNKTLGEVHQRDHGRVPDSAVHTTVDFFLEGDNSQALSMSSIVNGQTQRVQDFRVRATLDTAGAFDTVVEYFTGFAGI